MVKSASSEWRADHLRISLFSDIAWGSEAAQIFQSIFSIEPVETSRKPAIGVSSASGSANDGRLTVTRTINRVDVVIQPEGESSVPTPMLDNVEFRLNQLRELVSRWATVQQQAIVRIAVGGRIFLPTADIVESYKKLKELVQVIQIDVERFREMQFQVNLARKSTVIPDLNINRLTVWGSVVVATGLIEGAAISRPMLDQTYCTCTIDMNTTQTVTVPFQTNEVVALLSEVCSEAIAVLHGGIS